MSKTNTKKSKFIYLCSLLAFVLGLSIFTVYSQSAQTEQINQKDVLTASAESGTLNDVESTIAQDTPIGISPMGWWEDMFKIPEEINVYGTLHAGDYNSTVSDGTYTNKAIGYTAPSGFPQMQIGSPNNNNEFSTTVLGNRYMLSNSNTNGWYYFRGYKPDPKGDYTKVSRIYLDTVKPQAQVQNNGESVASGSYVGSSAVISIFGSDNVSGIASYWYSLNNSSYNRCYASSTFTADGTYSFYVIDGAGNVSDTVTIIKDSVKPTVGAYNNSTGASISGFTNATTLRFSASDAFSGVNSIHITRPDSSTFLSLKLYTTYSGSSVTLSSLEGEYRYYAKDKSGNNSSTYAFIVDKTVPTAQLYSSTSAVSNNSLSTASYIKFVSTDANAVTCYVKKGSGSFSLYTSGTQITAEGIYTFYAIDPAGNKTAEYKITLDRTAPVGTLYAGSTSVSSGKTTNASYISYTATDNVELVACYVKKPGASSYVTFTNSTQYTADGVYYFYAVDRLGFTTPTVSITLDRTKPTVSIYGETTTLPSGSYTNKSYVSFAASDSGTGLAGLFVKLPGSSSYISYVSGTPFYGEGTYYFYATDVAGNTSDTVSVTLDMSNPVGNITANGATINSGGFVNKAFYYTGSDSVSGVAKCEIKRPNGNWETYTSGTTINASSANGLYTFRTTDRAGNVSNESTINLVTVAPTITIYAGSSVVSSGTNTNKGYVSFTANALNGATASLFVKSPGSSEYIAYVSGTKLYQEGIYHFYASDNAGNVSTTVNVTLDISAPVGTITSDGKSISNGGFTNKSFFYTGTDSVSGVAKCEIKRPNGSWEAYTSGTVLAASNTNGLYLFRTIDKAGNLSSETGINLVTISPSVNIFAGSSIAQSGTYTNKGYVSFTATASSGTTASLFIKSPDSNDYTAYVEGTVLYREGVYYFYAIDNAGNVSATVNITLDVSVPTGTVVSDSTIISNDGYTNKAFSYTGTDTISGIAKLEIKRPEGVWETYQAGTEIQSNELSGWYVFRCVDKAGNVSAESRVCLMTTLPDITIYAGTSLIASGSYTNKSYVSFAVSDAVSGTTNLYVCIPDSEEFILYVVGTPLYREGTYYIYACDAAGNESEVMSITLDMTLPAGTIKSDGMILSNNNHTNQSFAYEATDSGSGIAKLEIKRPNGAWENYMSGSSIDSNEADGWYAFRCIDKAGNVSVESLVCLMTAIPKVTIKAGANTIESGSFTNKSISFAVSTAISGATNLYVRLPNSSDYILYIAGTPLLDEGIYFVYACDAAGNVSEELSITLDTSKPIGAIKSGNVNMPSNSYTNNSFSYSATDEISSIANCEIKRPNGVWESYTIGTEIPAIVGGWYAFRSIDKGGNLSDETLICLITVSPSITLYANEEPINNGSYTNLARISMSASGDYVKTCYVKLPNTTDFIIYSQFYSFTSVGRYEFYAEDLAGGTSDIFVVIIDRTAKKAELNGVNSGVANGDVTVAWENNDLLTKAPIISVTINGKNYTKGTAIRTIDGGIYIVETTDASGNTWTTSFTAKRIEVLSDTLNKQYFETVDSSGSSYAFENYAEAFAFAKSRENALVRTGVWNGAVWDGGIAMDNIDSVNAKNGTYYIYKKSGDVNTEVAYFTLDRLNAVIAEYAVETISSYYWWQKTPAQIYNGNDLYSLRDTQTFVGNSVQFAGHASYLIDGEEYYELTYSVEGVHVLTIMDDYGNSYQYTLIIVCKAPDIMYALGEGMSNRATFDRNYYFNNVVTINIEDEYDDYAMFNVYSENGKLIACLSIGDAFAFDKSGKYTVQAVNHHGLSEVFTLFVSLDAPKTQIIENTVDKKLEIEITKSTDTHSQLQTLEIYKSIDGGKTWILISVDDYGNAVSLGRLKYSFRTTGLYRVVLTDEYRSGIDAVTIQYDYVQAKPEGILIGVENNGHTSGDVSFKWTDDAVVSLVKDGNVMLYTSGQKLTEDGEYVLTFENFDGYKLVYSFVIDTAAPEISFSETVNKAVINNDVSVFWEEENLVALLYKNGTLIGEYKSGTRISENGNYRIVVADAAKNMTEISFVIDRTVDYTINVNDKGISNSVTVYAEEELEAVLIKNGEVISYTVGESINEEGQYSVKVTDKFGNSEEISFIIINPLTTNFEFNFDEMPGFEKVTVNGEDKRLNYGTLELKIDGIYDVGVIVNGISYNFTVTVDTTAPTLVLNGVQNGGTTKEAVVLTENSEDAEVKVFFNGTEIEYSLGDRLSQAGKYRVVIQDQCGNKTEYTFEIVPSMNGGVIALVVIAIIALIGTGVFLFLKKTKKI